MSSDITWIQLPCISFGYTFTSMNKENRPSSYPLRLPAELREKLEQSAKENNRPLSSEILMRLEYTFDESVQERASLMVEDLKSLTTENAKRLDQLEQTVRSLMRERIRVINPDVKKI